jgi:hypothetical protein
LVVATACQPAAPSKPESVRAASTAALRTRAGPVAAAVVAVTELAAVVRAVAADV